ncbi:MAG TPA: SigE family RNA polymerase sigma factor [Streptosporangiaceae bacterium]|nr:SigE family RNA polymerase sigma factor [Streptosporangiaceae bacterium]
MTPTEAEFVQFAEAGSARLRRTAFLLCGDWHTAEDLTQATLAKVFVAWRRISRRDAVNAYAMRTLLNTYLAESRKKRPGEVLMGQLPEQRVEAPAPELRMAVLEALAMLPPKARAVVVLRYWEDQSIEQTAALLGCTTGNVKSQSARALDKLRLLLDAATAEPTAGYPTGHPSGTREGDHGRDIASRTS